MGEVGQWEESGWQWRFRWRRARVEWESIQEEDMLRLISANILNREEQDQQLWGGGGTGEFSVKSAYNCLASHATGEQMGFFNLLWQAKAFPSVLVTSWRSLLDRLPTTSNLIRREVMVSSSLSALCQETEESSQHLFVECVAAQWV